jgi:esterase/lipase superfamily enzyme
MTQHTGRVFPLAPLLIVSALLTGCASRPETGFLTPTTGTALGATEHSLLVATTRERDARPGALFSGERSGVLDYALVTASVPPIHASGEVEWPSTPPGNPNTDFVVRKADYLNGDQEFIRALNAQLAMRPRGSRKVMIFVHGFNTLFSEGVYRLAQVDHDAQTVDIPVLFSWASRGKLTDYIYDSNSATPARDELAHTLLLLFASEAEQVNILAHSMGNWITVEALRQIAIAGQMPRNENLALSFSRRPTLISMFLSLNCAGSRSHEGHFTSSCPETIRPCRSQVSSPAERRDLVPTGIPANWLL